MPPAFQSFEYGIPVFTPDAAHVPIYYETGNVIDPGSAIEDRNSSPKIDLLRFVQGVKLVGNLLNELRLRLCQGCIG